MRLGFPFKLFGNPGILDALGIIICTFMPKSSIETNISTNVDKSRPGCAILDISLLFNSFERYHSVS